jgi:hypothetical protein
MIGALILSILFYMGFLFGTQGPSALPASNLPGNNSVVNAVNNTVIAVNNQVNKAVNTVNNQMNKAAEAVGNTIDSAANAVGLGNTNKNRVGRNNGILNNLSNILKTPANVNRTNRRLSV